jgi:hypothetical protein
MSKQKVFLNTSDLAAYINQNKYDFVTPFERLWKKVDFTEYTNALNELDKNLLTKEMTVNKLVNEKELLQLELSEKKITKRQYNKLLNEIEKKEKTVETELNSLNTKIDKIKLTQSELIEKSLGADLISKINNVTIDTQEKKAITNKLIEDLKVSNETKTELLKQTEGFINKTHGTMKEDSAIKMFEDQFKVTLDISQTYNKVFLKEISKNSKYDWYIGGKVDGLYIDSSNRSNSYVVEVKSRIKGFFNSLRDYEKTQIQIYIHMLKLNQAKLVEKYKNKIRVTEVIKDDQYIDDIFVYINIFIKNFEQRFLDDFESKVSYLNYSDEQKKKFIRNMYLDEISNKETALYELRMIESEDCLIDDLD